MRTQYTLVVVKDHVPQKVKDAFTLFIALGFIVLGSVIAVAVAHALGLLIFWGAMIVYLTL